MSEFSYAVCFAILSTFLPFLFLAWKMPELKVDVIWKRTPNCYSQANKRKHSPTITPTKSRSDSILFYGILEHTCSALIYITMQISRGGKMFGFTLNSKGKVNECFVIHQLAKEKKYIYIIYSVVFAWIYCIEIIYSAFGLCQLRPDSLFTVTFFSRYFFFCSIEIGFFWVWTFLHCNCVRNFWKESQYQILWLIILVWCGVYGSYNGDGKNCFFLVISKAVDVGIHKYIHHQR